MINVKIEEDELLDLLMDRVDYWSDDNVVHALYYDMYKNAIESGVFEGSELDVMGIVDNDYVNWCEIIYAEDTKNFEPLLKMYNELGLGCCGEIPDYTFNVLEAVEKDNEGEPVAFLIRC